LAGFLLEDLLVTDFKETEMRKKCRHCRMRLPAPTSNEREAFCTRGCYNSFYLHRCLVCEKAIERTTANRKICKKSKCRNALQAGEGFGRYHADSGKTSPASKNPELMQKPLISSGSASASNTVDQANKVFAERPWRMAAGNLTANQYHCAVVGDAPNPNGGLPDIRYAQVWADGDWQGTENRNRKLLGKHLARGADKAPAPVAPATVIDAKRVAALIATIPADLSIPPFLTTASSVEGGRMTRPRRYRLRCYVRAARSILWALDHLSDREIRRRYTQ
jgi:hypothetical protein